jgi:crotonobetainyl-CoA:carnitine CoA-transferase CaiB-like acyl-CoA transferase
MGPLDGIKVLDLSRILAGPTATQLLGDLGAEVIKIENPLTNGDDTRAWGPPYVKDAQGNQTDLSAYFMAANRNKQSVSIDISSVLGQNQIRQLSADADIIVENFKPGSLDKYGLDHCTMLNAYPHLVYCSISGFGQTGPNASKPGYDLMAQGYGGIMSLTGAPDGEPMKVGVGVSDVMCGMYATVGILAALRHRDLTGEGQHIDLALIDTQVAWLVNEGVNYLTSGKVPTRLGNGHPNIAPYQVFRAADGEVIVAVGNDAQFKRFVNWLGAPQLALDPRFATNPARLENRGALIDALGPLIAAQSVKTVVEGLESCKIPVGPVNTLDKVFASEQVQFRDMKIQMPLDCTENGSVSLIGNPLKFSKTPVAYRRAPPRFGQHTKAILERLSQNKANENASGGQQ